MGVPAFFRWLSIKYPRVLCNVQEDTSQFQGGTYVPINTDQPNPNGIEFDNLFLDMNGIVHNCSHGEDLDAPPSGEGEMFSNIFAYLDRLFAVVQPRKLMYMAVDGVAPRAKMNQQRSRRFCAARDRDEIQQIDDDIRAELKAKGMKVPPKKPLSWDHNVITPGTEFMIKLSFALRYYVHDRMTRYSAWRNVRVILSDASVPGEGEHKIIKFIRHQRVQEGYDPNQRHIIHGLDADLIMLALATHEPHFTVLRERVFDDKRKARPQPHDPVLGASVGGSGGDAGGADAATLAQIPSFMKKPLQFLHIHILREYLEAEFKPVAPSLPFPFDIEAVIDDFVFMCFFVGNDFLPHLPSLDIREGAIGLLLNLYKRVLPSLSGYLTEAGEVNLVRVDAFLAEVALVEEEVFSRRMQTIRRDEQRRARDQGAREAARKRHGGALHGPDKFPAAQKAAQPRVEARVVPISDLRGSKRQRISTTQAKEVKPEPAAAVKTEAQGEEAAHPAKAEAEAGASGAASEQPSQAGDGTGAVKAESGAAVKEEQPAGTGTGVKEEEDDDDDDEEPDDTAGLEMKAPTPPEVRAPTRAEEARYQQEFRTKKRQWERDDTVQDHIRLGDKGWKDRYYLLKFGEEASDPAYRQEVCARYVEGLCWVMRYYYAGCASWSWYYPYHYAPCASDLRGLAAMSISFSLDEPFLPVDQLLAVQPSAGAHMVPKPCRPLMTSEDSPIADFYPRKFAMDPNGKKMRWQWVALLPFVDERRLRRAISSVEPEFSEEDRERNRRGCTLIYAHMDSVSESSDVGKAGREREPTENPWRGWKSNGRAAFPAPEEFDYDARPLGVAGFARTPRLENPPAVGQSVPPPLPRLEDVKDQRCLVFEYEDPPYAQHVCRLLPGARAPPKVLVVGEEVTALREPRFGRGVNVADLGLRRPSSHGGDFRFSGGRGRGGRRDYRDNRDYRQGPGHRGRGPPMRPMPAGVGRGVYRPMPVPPRGAPVYQPLGGRGPQYGHPGVPLPPGPHYPSSGYGGHAAPITAHPLVAQQTAAGSRPVYQPLGRGGPAPPQMPLQPPPGRGVAVPGGRYPPAPQRGPPGGAAHAPHVAAGSASWSQGRGSVTNYSAPRPPSNSGQGSRFSFGPGAAWTGGTAPGQSLRSQLMETLKRRDAASSGSNPFAALRK